MKRPAKYKAISVTEPVIEPLSLVIPNSDDERAQTNFSAFAPEWSSSLDSVYDVLGRAVG
jgi:hypothetical protein